MRTRIKRIIFAAIALAGLNVWALNYTFQHGGTPDANGFYNWHQTTNWATGVIPAPSGDAAVFSGLNNKALVTNSFSIQAITMSSGSATICGTNDSTITANYVNMNSGTLTLENIKLTASSSIRSGGTGTELILRGDSRVTGTLGANVANSTLSVTLYDNSVFDGLKAPSFQTSGSLIGGAITLNDKSSLISSVNVAILDNNYLANGMKFFLNDSASITFSVDTGNSDRIIKCITNGTIYINGKTGTSVIYGTDYTYDEVTGKLQVIPEAGTIGLFIISGSILTVVRRSLR